MAVTLNGQDYRIQWTKNRRTMGQIDYERGIIRLSSKLKGQALVDTIIHECLHAWFPRHEESTIDQAATEIAVALSTIMKDT